MEKKSGNRKSLQIAVATYNILHGGKYLQSETHKDLPLSDWLFNFAPRYVQSAEDTESLENESDIYAVGFQEMEDIGSENQKAWVEELDKTVKARGYHLLQTIQLSHFFIGVYVRPELLEHIQNVEADSKMTRAAPGAAGSKGGVAIRFEIFGNSLCFITSHFMHGQAEIQDRYDDYARIKKDILRGSLETHDFIFWCGDLNFRVDMDREKVKALVSKQEWSTLLQKDQLTQGKMAGDVFVGYHEGEIRFAPTYKYDLFSEEYDTSEKMRIPSWTDRVLWKRKMPADDKNSAQLDSGKCLYYGRAELLQSDHRPVLAVIKMPIAGYKMPA